MQYLPQCIMCKHYTGERRCEAFPEGIPNEIMKNDIVHDTVLQGQDKPLVYERDDAYVDRKTEAE